MGKKGEAIVKVLERQRSPVASPSFTVKYNSDTIISIQFKNLKLTTIFKFQTIR